MKFSNESAYNDWSKSQVSAEGRKIVVHDTQELFGYAIDQSLQSKLRSENLQLAEYIYDKFSHHDSTLTDDDVLKAFDEFYQKFNSLQDQHHLYSRHEGLSFRYLKSFDRLLAVSQEGWAKIVHRDVNGDFQLDQLNFDRSPTTWTDSILFLLSREELLQLFQFTGWEVLVDKHSEMKQSYLQFLTSAKDTLTLSGKDSCYLAFASTVKCSKAVIDDLLFTLSKLRIAKSREFENLSVIGLDDRIHKHQADSVDVSQISQFWKFAKAVSSLTVHDINTLLNIVNKLDEQMWCKSVFSSSSDELVKLFTSVSRPYSALDRLSSFVAQDVSLHGFADYGFVWRGDEVLQSVFNYNEEIKAITKYCIDPIVSSLVLRNNVNWELHNSLNYLPPTLLHKSAKIVTSEWSDLVFTFSDEGVWRIYSTDLGLIELGRLDFSQDASDAISDALESKKYIGQIVNFEITNVKAETNCSNNVPLNVKKDKLKLTKSAEVVNKFKPK